jgi:hypothetical protein
MELGLHAIEQIVNPIELVHLLSDDLQLSGAGQYTTKCPKCESKLYILDKEFVCENSLCFFRAGSVVDYLVVRGICTWDESIETLNRILDNRIKNSYLYKNQKSITAQLKNKRKIFDLFLKKILSTSQDNIKIIQYRSALRSQGLDPEILKHSVFVLNEAETEQLKSTIESLNPDKTINISGINIVLPYFSSYHNIAHLIVLKSPDAKPDKVPVNTSRTSFFGLLQRHPGCKDTHLGFTYAVASKLNTQYGLVNPETVCLHMMHDPTSEGQAIVLPQAKYIATGVNNADLRSVSTIQRYIPKLEVITSKIFLHKEQETVPSDEFVLQCVIKELQNKISINNILSLVDLTPKSRQGLLERLHANRYFNEAEEVRNFFKTLPIYKDDKVTLFSNPHGYTLRKHNSENFNNHVSNFTIELEKNIVFSESTDIFHAGQLHFNNESFNIVFKQEELDKVTELEKVTRRATLGSVSSEINIPTIKDRSAGKYLTTYFREQIAQLPRVEGVPMLGWSPRRTSFYSPYFIADKKSVRAGKKYLHPSLVTLTNYTNDVEDTARLYYDLPDCIVNILNQSASFIARSFLSMQVRPLPFYNNSEARRLLTDIFLSLGQTCLLQLNNNMRGEEVPGLRGFPFCGVGYTSAQVVKSNVPGFILCDAGTIINEIFPPDVINKAQHTLRFIIKNVVKWAIDTKAENFQQVNSVSRSNAYSKEGANIIIDSCNLTSWPSSKTPFENLDSLLGTIGFDEVKNYFVSNINTHKLQIKNEILNKVANRQGLENELRSISKHVDFTEDTVDVDSESMLEALNSYYHMNPVLTEYFDSEKLFKY